MLYSDTHFSYTFEGVHNQGIFAALFLYYDVYALNASCAEYVFGCEFVQLQKSYTLYFFSFTSDSL